MNEVFFCKNCLNMSTRPRITFDKRGWCNACQWMEEKKTFDWSKREEELNTLLDKYRSKTGDFDCVVPVSGGKDGSYIAYTLKEKYGMNPILYTYDWGLTTDISRRNQANLCGKLGLEHILRAADIQQKRKNILQNINAWLKEPFQDLVS